MAVHVDVYTELNRSSIDRSAADIQRELERRGEKAGQGYTAGFARAVERDDAVRAAADKVADKLDKVVAAEAKRATQLEKSKAINEAVAESEAKVNRLRSSGAEESAKAAESDLAKLREKQVEINNKLVVSATAVSTAERARAAAVREAGDAYRKMGDDAESAMTKIGNFGDKHRGGAIGLNVGLTGIGLLPAAATAITEVAGAVQQLAGAGLAVPGIFAGIAASVGTGALGMYGMSDAIKAVDKASDGTKSSVEAANKALAALPASSADVVRTVVGLKGTFQDLQGIASTNMFAGVSDGIRGLAAADLPAVTRGIDGISRGINQNLLQAMNSLGSSSSQGFLDRIFGNTASAQSKLTAAIDPIVHAVGTLSAAGSDTLPRLADAVGKVADRFDRFISAADGDGRLKKWIDEGLDGFTNLGNTALNIGKSFTAITEAAGGGAGLLGTLESATGRMSAFLNSTEGQAKLKDFFAEGRDMLAQLKDVATSAGPVLAGVFQSGISAANLWLPVIKQALDMLNGIPGGAALAVGAFATWKTIAGVASLIASLQKIKDLLGVGIPNAATGVGGKLNSALALTGPLAAVTALSAAYDGILHKLDKITNTNIPSTVGQIPGSGAWVYDRVVGDKPWLPQQNATGSANPNQNVMPGPTGAASVVTAPAGTPYDPFAVAGIPRPASRGVGGVARPGGPWNATPSVGVSGYTAPVITEAPKGGAAATPYIDPSKYAMGDPLAGLPGAVPGADPTKIYDADSKVITATHNLEQGRLALQVLEAKGNATQQELLTAKNNLVEQERALYNAQADDVKARTNQMKQSMSDLKDVFAPLDSDFGVSKGLPGIVENLVKTLGNFAMAGAIRSSPELQAAAISLMSPQTGSASAGYAGYAASALGPAALRPPGYGVPVAGAQTGGTYGLPTGTNTGGYGTGTSSTFPQWAMELGKAFGVTPSTYAGHQETDRHEAGYAPNPTHENRGIDWSGSVANMQKFADYLKTIPQDLEQVIWNGGGVGSGDTVEIAGGRPQPGYFAGDLAGHGNHVHTRQSEPIPLPGMAAAPYDPYASAAPGYTSAVSPTAWGGPLPSLPAGGGGGQGYGPGAPGPGMVGAGIPATPLIGGGGGSVLPTYAPAAASGGGGGGGGGGGLLGAAEDAGGMALDVMAPGAGEAAKVGIQLGKRAIQFGAQAAAIGVGGLMETFIPHGSPNADPGKSWFGRIAAGVSGARPAAQNMAAQKAPPPAPVGSPASGQGSGKPPGPQVGVQMNNPTFTGSDHSVANEINRHQGAAYGGW